MKLKMVTGFEAADLERNVNEFLVQLEAHETKKYHIIELKVQVTELEYSCSILYTEIGE